MINLLKKIYLLFLIISIILLLSPKETPTPIKQKKYFKSEIVNQPLSQAVNNLGNQRADNLMIRQSNFTKELSSKSQVKFINQVINNFNKSNFNPLSIYNVGIVF